MSSLPRARRDWWLQEYDRIVNAEFRIINEKMDNIINTGANVILSRLPIGDLATQYFADRGLFCAGRVLREDLARVAKATGAKVDAALHALRVLFAPSSPFRICEHARCGRGRLTFLVLH